MALPFGIPAQDGSWMMKEGPLSLAHMSAQVMLDIWKTMGPSLECSTFISLKIIKTKGEAHSLNILNMYPSQ